MLQESDMFESLRSSYVNNKDNVLRQALHEWVQLVKDSCWFVGICVVHSAILYASTYLLAMRTVANLLSPDIGTISWGEDEGISCCRRRQ